MTRPELAAKKFIEFVGTSPMTQGLEKKISDILLPAIQEDFPQLLHDKQHLALLNKIKMVTSRMFIFHLMLARMRKTDLEDRINILFSSLYVIYDTLFDDPAYYQISNPSSFQRLKNGISGLSVDKGSSALESLFLIINKEILALLPPAQREVFVRTFLSLNEAQYESAFFLQPDLDRERLKDNTFRRGGFATQLAAVIGAGSVSNQELEAYNCLGKALQVSDDLGDVEEDQKYGLQTVGTLGLMTAKDVWIFYQEAYRQLKDLATSHSYDKNVFELFHGMISFYILKNLDIHSKASGVNAN